MEYIILVWNEHSHTFDIISLFFLSGTSSDKPLQFTRKESKVIKSILRTHPECQDAKSILKWTIYDCKYFLVHLEIANILFVDNLK